jgi:hypothetical protein
LDYRNLEKEKDMPRFQILTGPDRLGFANSLFAHIDASPQVGYSAPPHCRGGIKVPTYRGESFLTKNEEGSERELPLIIISVRRKHNGNDEVEFTAALWAACDKFRDLLFFNSIDPWVEFKGELDFTTKKGWIDQIIS